MSNKKVTVVVPFYLAEEYIGECLHSIIHQTHKNLEILCVDDCGRDNSVVFIKDIAETDQRVKVMVHIRNMGAAVARNTGIQRASGEFLCFVDSDDVLVPTAIEDMLNCIIESGCDVVWSNTKVILESGGDEQRMVDVMNYLSYVPPQSKTQVCVNNFAATLDCVPCVPWNKLFKTNFLRRNEVFFVDKRLAVEDEGFHVKWLANSPLMYHLNKVCYHHRIRESSVMHELEVDVESRFKQLRYVIDDSIDYLKKNNLDEYIELTKSRPLYRHCYAAENKKKPSVFSKLIRIRVRKNHKRIQIFGITLYESKS